MHRNVTSITSETPGKTFEDAAAAAAEAWVEPVENAAQDDAAASTSAAIKQDISRYGMTVLHMIRRH